MRTAKSLARWLAPVSLLVSGSICSVEAYAHGYISSPKSRVIMCAENGIENPTLPACIAAKAAGNEGMYTPQEISVGGVKDDHQYYIPDGRLCSANRSNLYGLDLARSDWPASQVSPGAQNFVWTMTAQHKSKYFRYYITREGYDFSQPLRWDDLDLIYDSGPADRQATATHTVTLPYRTGKHIIYSIWQRDWETDSAEGFYQCVDVDFGGASSSLSSSSVAVSSSSVASSVVSSSSAVSSSSVASSSVASSVASSVVSSVSNDTCADKVEWTAAAIFRAQDQVAYNGNRYSAKWYTQGDNPETYSGTYDVWVNLGACVSGASSSSISSVSSSSVSSSSVSSISSSVQSSSVASSSQSSVASSCTSPAYVSGSSYATGDLVQNAGSEYKCTVGGWCTVGGPYAPGTGWAWTNAWSLVRACN